MPPMTMIVRTAALFAGLAVASPAWADELADGIAAMPAGVEDVEIAGAWTENDKAGVYRLVIARTGAAPVTARLFVQWIAIEGSGAGRVDHSMEIAELAGLGIDIASLAAETEEAGGLSVFIDSVEAGEPGLTYELFVDGRDDYRFGPASN